MKIIGIGNGGYIIETTSEELANLIGWHSLWDTEESRRRLQVGDEVHIHDMYKQLYDLAKNSETLTKVAAELVKYANLLKRVEPITVATPEAEREKKKETEKANAKSTKRG